jgi:hypothetical protein
MREELRSGIPTLTLVDHRLVCRRNTRWSTDHKRQKRFDDPGDASAVCDELRDLCPRNAEVINIEVAQDEP